MPLALRALDGGTVVPVATLGFAFRNDASVLLMSPAATTDDLTGRDRDSFRVDASTQDSANGIARHSFNRQCRRRLAAAGELCKRFTASRDRRSTMAG
jgi:hypothetical protein